jgi:hypothetical protein
VVVVDRDDDDCAKLKKRLEAMAAEAGLATKSKPKSKRFAVVNRLAIEELEAWYFGDWEAVQQAYPKVNANVPSQARDVLYDCAAPRVQDCRILPRNGASHDT